MKQLLSIGKAIAIVVIVAGLAGCSKDNLELLSGSTWDFEDYTTDAENTDIQTFITIGKGLYSDGTMEFTADGAYEISSPALRALDQVETGTWELIGSSQLILTTGGIPRTATIDELTKKKLVYIETYTYDGETYSTINTWVK